MARKISRTQLFLQQKICLLSSVAIFVYNRSAISVNRRDVSLQFLSSFSRLFIQEYETDCCLRNRTDNNTNTMNPALQQTGSRNLTDQKTLAYTKYMFNVHKNQQSRQTGSRNLMDAKTLLTIWGTYMKLVTKYQISAINSC